jgi:hypothetical protein
MSETTLTAFDPQPVQAPPALDVEVVYLGPRIVFLQPGSAWALRLRNRGRTAVRVTGGEYTFQEAMTELMQTRPLELSRRIVLGPGEMAHLPISIDVLSDFTLVGGDRKVSLHIEYEPLNEEETFSLETTVTLA